MKIFSEEFILLLFSAAADRKRNCDLLHSGELQCLSQEAGQSLTPVYQKE